MAHAQVPHILPGCLGHSLHGALLTSHYMMILPLGHHNCSIYPADCHTAAQYYPTLLIDAGALVVMITVILMRVMMLLVTSGYNRGRLGIYIYSILLTITYGFYFWEVCEVNYTYVAVFR